VAAARVCAAMFVLWAVVATCATSALASEAELPAPATPQFSGTIAGTVLWAGRSRQWLPHDDCEVHAFDMEGHPGVETGLGNVVVVARPLGRTNQDWFREHGWADDADDTAIDWDEEPFSPVVAVALGRALVIRNERTIARQLRVYRGRELVETIEIDAKAEQKVTLSQGVFRIVDPASRTKAWAYVTPYPATVSNGNCRFVFSNLPFGRYRLTGWHPRAGSRSREFPVQKRKINVLTPLLFGAAGESCKSEGFSCYGPDKTP
jgi:hypothetical protein